jgi:hypothetical protein
VGLCTDVPQAVLFPSGAVHAAPVTEIQTLIGARYFVLLLESPSLCCVKAKPPEMMLKATSAKAGVRAQVGTGLILNLSTEIFINRPSVAFQKA